jgi:hypothetical protein
LHYGLRLRAAGALAILLTLALAGVAHAAPGVDPQTVEITLASGASTDVAKVVHTPPIPPKVDVYFLSDTTGSMTSVIANVQANAGSILSAVSGGSADAAFGAGDYKDFPFDVYAFNNGASIGSAAAANTAISAWSAAGGADGPEGQLFALHQLADGAAGYRAGATKVLVWFGDAPGHDPVCDAINGGAGDLTEASVTGELVSAGIKVIAVSTTTGYPAGLDDDPAATSDDYGVCGTPGGSPGQATRIAGATGGTVFTDVPPGDVSNAILTGLSNLPVEVTPSVSCDTGLGATFSPASKTVTSGDDASFTETLTLDPAPPVGDLHCTVEFLLNGEPGGDAFVQHVTVHHNLPPDCSTLSLSKTSLWPPNHKFQTVTASGATDPEGDALTTTVTAVTQDEPLNGPGDGDTTPDAAHVAGHPEQVQLRAERTGTGDGRVYRVVVTVSDGSLTCSKTMNVGVPHDQSSGPAVDSGLFVDSFGP